LSKSVYIPDFNLSYIEGKKPVYLQVYRHNDDNTASVGFVLADDDNDAKIVGEAQGGEILFSARLLSLFDRLRLFVDLDKKIKAS
jgi:hypothetical protein